MRHLLLSLAALAVASIGCGRAPQPAASHAAPAKLKTVAEADLGTITLTPEAEARLGVQTQAVEEKAVERTRNVAGEVVVPSGRALIVTSPVSGSVLAAGEAPSAGQIVAKGQALFRLRPHPSSAELAAAPARLEVARARLQRAEQMLAVGAGSARAVEEARADLLVAESNSQSLRPGADAGHAGALVVSSPESGLVRNVHVAAGQSVAAGAPLFEVVARDPLWVRVPVYVGDLASVDQTREARVHDLAEAAGSAGRLARIVVGPASADSGAATADLFFETANPDGGLRPGQRVNVSLALRSQGRALVVSWSSVLYDIHGAAWVYENTAPHAFVRRRVEVRRVAGDLAVLERGPAVGARIVTAGAAELFGTELGSGK